MYDGISTNDRSVFHSTAQKPRWRNRECYVDPGFRSGVEASLGQKTEGMTWASRD
ncbi:hypothetical protein P7K49_010610 [Saguinus oedipus]|uniref:Uncharacterized protein n=1 Tax=Saguinus oedipus TaxID=9490 RepID=A0ABQ9VN98_SAGOE|nr:hypothetical protein P7K49_010610 [Saguinus oedipus]